MAAAMTAALRIFLIPHRFALFPTGFGKSSVSNSDVWWLNDGQ